MSTFDAWNVLINEAKKTILIGSFYWTLKSDEVYNHSSSVYGDKIFQSLLAAGADRKIDIRIAQNMPSQVSPNIDTEILMKRKAAKVRSVNFMRLFGAGVLHTKVWVVDGQHFYIGSANMVRKTIFIDVSQLIQLISLRTGARSRRSKSSAFSSQIALVLQRT
jgi:phospholipase D3/4